jgi:hypothetical protein
MHTDLQPSATVVDWTLGTRGMELLALQAIPLSLNLLIYALVGYFILYKRFYDFNIKKKN